MEPPGTPERMNTPERSVDMTTRWLNRTMITGAALLWSASLASAEISSTNGYYNAKPGVECVTREHCFATVFRWDFEKVSNMMTANDLAALRKMEAEKRFVYTRSGIPVIIEARYERMLEVRPKGETFSIYM